MKQITHFLINCALTGSANTHSCIDKRVKNRLQIERRTADDFQHIGGGGLLRQRFGKVARARFHLVEQPHILDGDDGLIGESLHQFYLALREGTCLSAPEGEHALDFAVAQQRNSKQRPHLIYRDRAGECVFSVQLQIRYVFHFPGSCNAWRD